MQLSGSMSISRTQPNVIPADKRMYFSIREAAGHVGVTYHLLYAEVKSKHLPVYYLAGDPKREMRIKREDLQDWMNGTLQNRRETERQKRNEEAARARENEVRQRKERACEEIHEAKLLG